MEAVRSDPRPAAESASSDIFCEASAFTENVNGCGMATQRLQGHPEMDWILISSQHVAEADVGHLQLLGPQEGKG